MNRREYYLKHKEAFDAYRKIYREIFREEIREYRHNYHIEHAEHDAEMTAKWYQRNKEEHCKRTSANSQRVRDGARMMFPHVGNVDNFGRMFRRMFK